MILSIGTLLPVDASSQNRRLIVVSPRVGVAIDWQEAATYRLFPSIKNFHSASFYQAPDSAFWVVAQLRSTEGILHDSVFVTSYETLNAYAEQIDHWEELLQGTYRMGTSQPHIIYDDGTPINSPPAAFINSVAPRRYGHPDDLPLAPDTSGLVRPRFPTIRFDVSMGLMLSDFSELEQLTGSVTNLCMPWSFYVQIPIMEDPSILLLGGMGFAVGGGGGGSIATYSSFLLYQAGSSSSLRPIIGLGAGYISYSYDGSVVINASESYPEILLGLNIAPNTLDILLICPLTKGLNTTFESNSYTIRPAGLGLSLLLSL